jgi:hypothetical protein
VIRRPKGDIRSFPCSNTFCVFEETSGLLKKGGIVPGFRVQYRGWISRIWSLNLTWKIKE